MIESSKDSTRPCRRSFSNQSITICRALEERAVGMVNTAFAMNAIECKKLLHVKLPTYGNVTCMQVARMAESEVSRAPAAHLQAFFSTVAVQQVVRAHWTGNFDLNPFEIMTGVALLGVPVALRKSEYRYRDPDLRKTKKRRKVTDG